MCAYLFPYELIVQLGNHAVLGLHFFLEVGHELMGVVLRLEDFVLSTPARTKETIVERSSTELHGQLAVHVKGWGGDKRER